MAKSTIKIGAVKVTGTNTGSGVGVYSQENPFNTLNFKSLIGGGTITISGGTDEILISGSGGTGTGSGERIEKIFTQVSHGFSVGEVISWSGGTFIKAIADTTQLDEVVGFITLVAGDDFTVVFAGYVDGLTPLSLAANSTYFLSSSVAGGITTTSPTLTGTYSKPILTTFDTDTGLVFQYRDFSAATGTTGGGTDGVVSGATLSTGNIILQRTEGLADVVLDMTAPLPNIIGKVSTGGVLDILYADISGSYYHVTKGTTGLYQLRRTGNIIPNTGSIVQITATASDLYGTHVGDDINIRNSSGALTDGSFNLVAYLVPDPCAAFGIDSLTDIDDIGLKYVDVEVSGTGGEDFTIQVFDVQTSSEVTIPNGAQTKTGDGTYRVEVSSPGALARPYRVDIAGSSGTISVCIDTNTYSAQPIPPAQPEVFVSMLQFTAGGSSVPPTNVNLPMSTSPNGGDFRIHLTTDNTNTQNGTSGSGLISAINFTIDLQQGILGNMTYETTLVTGGIVGFTADSNRTTSKTLNLTLPIGFTDGYVQVFGITDDGNNGGMFVAVGSSSAWGVISDTSDVEYQLAGTAGKTYGYDAIGTSAILYRIDITPPN